MRYKTDLDLVERGLREALRIKINNLEDTIEERIQTKVEAALKEYYQTREVARSFGIDTNEYDNILIDSSIELRERWGIETK